MLPCSNQPLSEKCKIKYVKGENTKLAIKGTTEWWKKKSTTTRHKIIFKILEIDFIIVPHPKLKKALYNCINNGNEEGAQGGWYTLSLSYFHCALNEPTL